MAIGKGITIGARQTVQAPDGSTVLSFGVQLVDQGLALGVAVRGKSGAETQYVATVDARSLGYFITKAAGYLAGRPRRPAPAADPQADNAAAAFQPAPANATCARCGHGSHAHSFYFGPCAYAGCGCDEFVPA